MIARLTALATAAGLVLALGACGETRTQRAATGGLGGLIVGGPVGAAAGAAGGAVLDEGVEEKAERALD